jgi:hypothetical protein
MGMYFSIGGIPVGVAIVLGGALALSAICLVALDLVKKAVNTERPATEAPSRSYPFAVGLGLLGLLAGAALGYWVLGGVSGFLDSRPIYATLCAAVGAAVGSGFGALADAYLRRA